MAEARSEEEEENMRETREQVVRRQPNSSGGRPDRRKPEHRHSQGPLSSIRAVIKRTSNRSTSLSETSRERERDRERERERDRDRDRRRPEITILSAEPLASTSWFPGAAGGFPPPPPPAAQIWGPTIPPSIQPPPTYEEVIREKTQEQEQVLLPSSSCTSSSSPSRPVSTTTIATQTEPGSAPNPQDSQGERELRRPVRPQRPPLPYPSKPSHIDDITANEASLNSLDSDGVATADTQRYDLLTGLCSPLTSTSGAQTDHWDCSLAPITTQAPLERPRPRPRSKISLQPVSSEVKIQTLVKLRDDGLATLAARTGNNNTNQEVSQGKYLQELLEAFSADDWGFPDQRSDSSGLSQSESEEEEEVEGENMATLKARIQAFEQQQQQLADESCGDSKSGNIEACVVTKRPEPQPRLQGQPAKPSPPSVAPKPKNLTHAPKSFNKVLLEEDVLGGIGALKSSETPTMDINPKGHGCPEQVASCLPKSDLVLVPQPSKSTEKPSVSPKPQCAAENLPSTTPASTSAPVPAPRPPRPKLIPSVSDPSTKAPPRPPVAPRASMGAAQDKSSAAGHITPPVPPRPSVDTSSGGQTETKAENDEIQDTANQIVKIGSCRPGIPSKPAVLTSSRRGSAPNLTPKPTGASATPPDQNPVPAKPGQGSGVKPPTPASFMRKGSLKSESTSSATPSSSEPSLFPRPSSVKLLPLRPPPMKSIPGRPPPPAFSSSSPANQTPPPNKTPSVSASCSQTEPSPPSVTANQMKGKKLPKKGPPLPPRPKPGHPLYKSHVKQEVLIVLDDASPSHSEHMPGSEWTQTTFTPLIDTSQCLLDMDTHPDPIPDNQSKPALEGLSLTESQSILPVQPTEQKEQPDPSPVSGPRCVALFDYEGEEDDELTFSQGDVIALLELIGEEWGRGQIHKRTGIFPLNFTKVVEALPLLSAGETTKSASTETTVKESTELTSSPQDQDSVAVGWAVALFDFPGQTAEDLSFQKGALIQVMEHIDTEWKRGRLEGKEGLYPAAFTQPCSAQPIADQKTMAKVAKALFDFTAESDEELTLKAGDILTHVESVDEQWILGVLEGKRGIVPKNYISIL